VRGDRSFAGLVEYAPLRGEVAERLIAPVLKTGGFARASRVRISPSPPKSVSYPCHPRAEQRRQQPAHCQRYRYRGDGPPAWHLTAADQARIVSFMGGEPTVAAARWWDIPSIRPRVQRNGRASVYAGSRRNSGRTLERHPPHHHRDEWPCRIPGSSRDESSRSKQAQSLPLGECGQSRAASGGEAAGISLRPVRKAGPQIVSRGRAQVPRRGTSYSSSSCVAGSVG
jgi:hypothetical protein